MKKGSKIAAAALILTAAGGLGADIYGYMHLKNLPSGHVPGFTKIGDTVYIDSREREIDLSDPMCPERTPHTPEEYAYLRYFSNAESIIASRSVPPDSLEFVRGMEHLREIYAPGDYSDLSPLKMHDELESITVSAANVTDLSPLFDIGENTSAVILDGESLAKEQLDELSAHMQGGVTVFKGGRDGNGVLIYCSAGGVQQLFEPRLEIFRSEGTEMLIITVTNISGDAITFVPHMYAVRTKGEFETADYIYKEDEITLGHLEQIKIQVPVAWITGKGSDPLSYELTAVISGSEKAVSVIYGSYEDM